MTINQDVKTLGQDLTDQAKGAGDAAVEQTKTAIATVKTPLYAVIGASDHAAKVARELVTDLRTRAESLPVDLKNRTENLPGEVRGAAEGARERATAQAATVRPEAIRETVRGVLTEAVETARKAVRRYEKRGQMVVADIRRAPGFTKVLKSAEGAVDRVEDALEALISDAQGELKGVRKSASSTATKAKVTVRKASTRRTAAPKATATKASTRKATPRKATATKATTAKRTPAKKSAAKASTSK